MSHARRPGGPVAAAQNCAIDNPLSVVARGGGCTSWSSKWQFGWQLVGSAVRTFRWTPSFRRTGYKRELAPHDPQPFFDEAQIYLEQVAKARLGIPAR